MGGERRLPPSYQEPLDPATLTPHQLETYCQALEDYSASMDGVIQQYDKARQLLGG